MNGRTPIQAFIEGPKTESVKKLTAKPKQPNFKPPEIPRQTRHCQPITLSVHVGADCPVRFIDAFVEGLASLWMIVVIVFFRKVSVVA
jgi:hypothetical protein